MVVYDLQCASSHRFEGWFRSSDDFESQRDAGLLTCPVCGAADVQKVPAAVYLSKNSGTDPDQRLAELQSQVTQWARSVHEYVDKNYDDVGAGFSDEALKMHYGEIDKRNIRGTATADQVKELNDEGVEVTQLPPKPAAKDTLN